MNPLPRHRISPRRAAVLLGVLALLLAPAVPVGAASPVELAVRPLVAGSFEAGGWVGVSVTIVNTGAPTEGYLAADSPDGIARRFVELPAGARKQVTLYIRPQVFQRSVSIRFEQDGAAPTTASVDIRALDRSATHVGLVGDGSGNLRPQLVGAAGGARLADPIGLGQADLPERPEPLRGIETIVWADDSTGLSEGQRRAIERWVASGGHLVVVGGADWQVRTAAFADLLPIGTPTATDGVELGALATWTGSAAPPEATATIAAGEPHAGALVLASTEQGVPLLVSGTRGAGRVDYVAVDLATAAFRGWDGSATLWSRLIPQDRVEEFFGGGFPIEEEQANAMSQALAALPALEVPPAELLLAVIVGYIVLIGPVSYLVLRRLDRRELAWVTAPILVLLFTACSYGIGSSLKGSEVILNQVSLVRTTSDGTSATVQTYAGLFSPTRGSYDLTVEADALLAPLRSGFEEPGRQQTASYLTEQGDPAHLRGLSVGVFGYQAVRADAVVAHRPGLSVNWSVGDGAISGTVTNVAETTVEDVAIVSSSGGRRIGTLEPGQSMDFGLSVRNVNGSSASDGVYGFANFNPEDERQRQTMTRRQVIDALVGYGGWAPRGGFGGGVDRGPFIIGWRADEGPVPIAVDGEVVQRYAQVVEVISGRPTLGPGEVTLEPAQLATIVASTDGDAFVEGGTFVTLGNGEVVFDIALPLEATTLQPSKVTIITGGDPGMVLTNPGDFGAFMPPGYTAEIRDVASGEWRPLGSLNERSRFEAENPDSVIDATGRIRVRVIGAGLDDNFGQSSVFVSASVEGVIP